MVEDGAQLEVFCIREEIACSPEEQVLEPDGTEIALHSLQKEAARLKKKISQIHKLQNESHLDKSQLQKVSTLPKVEERFAEVQKQLALLRHSSVP